MREQYDRVFPDASEMNVVKRISEEHIGKSKVV